MAAIVTTRTMSSIVITQAMLTTTTQGIRIGSARLNKALMHKAIDDRSVAVPDADTQGVLTRLTRSENNAVLHTEESSEISQVNEGLLYDDLFQSMWKRRLGVMWKPQVKRWVYNGVQNVGRLTKSILDGTYKSHAPSPVQIYYPKRRTVMSIPFRDRVWQGYLNDSYIYPIMTKSFIWANMASQINKGTDKARELLRKYLWNHYTHDGLNGYVLQIDIHHYYQTIPRDKALELFKRRLPRSLYGYVEEIINSQYQDSFFAGSQLIQILGIAYLDEIDHFIKERLHIRYYIRYQDDFILMHRDREILENALRCIEEKLLELGLTLNTKKTRIYDINKDIPFLGFYYTLKKSGKIYMRVNPKRIKDIRRRLKRHPQSFPSYLGFLEKGDSQKIIERLREEFEYAEN